MSDIEKCAAQVPERPHYIHWHRCNRPAKGSRMMMGAPGDAPACGIHLRAKYFPWFAKGEQA